MILKSGVQIEQLCFHAIEFRIIIRVVIYISMYKQNLFKNRPRLTEFSEDSKRSSIVNKP
jgi:hypothetical protein